ncbi:UNVERIFIED_CONTAM: hypothetical protein Slati_2758900 [Sesamum latifolium]|uniref:Uncharacterized protein n=1 Tax=Sesamum latifolium TaxID=2727402 RepID=A0AAW2W257_9LAMI
MDEEGRTHTSKEDVVNEFVSFYRRLLGGERRREFIDLRYLRPWVRHVITQEEASALIQPVSREEIKLAFFDIEEDKAPGPDGYSSGFYKAAWPIIGEEITNAILEFFTTGCLLKQVNTTLLALIPKSLAKCICPGRSIGDNILLAQELLTGYNQQRLPKRCVLKGHLPLRYLGLPLLSSRLTISDCQPLLIKIDSRIKGWEGIQLSFAGRLQLIKSVLLALNIYWAMAFILPKGVIKEVKKRPGISMEGTFERGIPKGGMEPCFPSY